MFSAGKIMIIESDSKSRGQVPLWLSLPCDVPTHFMVTHGIKYFLKFHQVQVLSISTLKCVLKGDS